MKIYHNDACSKSRASCNLLNEQQVSFETREYLKQPLTKEELVELLAKLKMPAKDLVRTGEAAFKQHFQGKELSEEKWLEAMVQFPLLIQRPIIVKGDKAVIGRPIERVIELLKEATE